MRGGLSERGRRGGVLRDCDEVMIDSWLLSYARTGGARVKSESPVF